MKTTSPKQYETKLVHYPDREVAPWIILQFLACDCPDCDKDGHWYEHASFPTEGEQRTRHDNMWRPS